MSRQRVPYFCWRDGRPRWVPGPALRARGARGQDLKDADGHWLSRGAAIDAAEKLNASLRGASGAEATQKPLACRVAPDVAPRNDGVSRSVTALCDAYESSPHFTRRLKKRTRRGYALHLKIIRATLGDLAVTQLTKPDLAEMHAALEEGHGAAQGNAVLRTINVILNYAVNDLHWLAHNPAKKIEFAHTDGRLVLFTADEIMALVAAADALELPSIGDAVLLGVLTAQRQGDVLKLCDADIRDGKFIFRTGKTGRVAKVPATEPLKLRLEAMRARRALRWPNVTHTAEIVCELTGAPYLADGSRFRALFRMVRAEAAKTCPSVADKHFADLRDTSITWLFMSGCTTAEIATVTAHALRTVQDILDRHYFVRDDALAVSAALKFDTFLKTQARW